MTCPASFATPGFTPPRHPSYPPKKFSLLLRLGALHRPRGERDLALLHGDAKGDLRRSFLLERADLRLDQIREFVERDRFLADLASRLGEAFVQFLQLVHLFRRIAEGRDTQHAVDGTLRLFRYRRTQVRERARPPLFLRLEAAIPQIGERLKARLQRIEPEATAGIRDVRVIEPADHGVNAPARLPWRTRQAAGEKHVVFRLEPSQLRFE